MNVTFTCPGCEQTTNADFSVASDSISCAHCQLELRFPEDAFEDGRLRRCVACPSSDLFVRKDFPPRLGVAITVVGFAAASVAWYFHHALLTYGILFSTALADFALYLWLGDALSCYRCGAHYRGVGDLDAYGTFQLETHERHRQQTARMASSPHAPAQEHADG